MSKPEIMVGMDVAPDSADTAWQVSHDAAGLTELCVRLVMWEWWPTRATGQLAKTDALDAQVLARCAAVIQPPARPLPSATGPSGHTPSPSGHYRPAAHSGVTGSAYRARTWPSAKSQGGRRNWHRGDPQLQIQRQAHPAWQPQDARLQSVPGVGPVLTRVLLAAWPELGP